MHTDLGKFLQYLAKSAASARFD